MRDPGRIEAIEDRLRALADRVDRDRKEIAALREEVARLKEDAGPDPTAEEPREMGYREAPPPPPRPPSPAPAPSGSLARPMVVAVVAVAAAGVAAYVVRRSERPPATKAATTMAPARSPFVCESGSKTLEDHAIVAERGPAIVVENGCELHLVRCRVEGEVGIEYQGGITKITLDDSSITGHRATFEASQGGIHEVRGTRSFVKGPLRVDGSIFTGSGLVAFPPAEVPGFPTVAPLAPLAKARAANLLPERAKLVELQARFVGTGALVDFASKLYASEVDYTFEVDLGVPPAPPPPDLPPGVPRPPPPAVDRREIHTVRLTAEGILAGRAKREQTPPRRDAPAEPRCSITDVWKKALDEGVAKDAVAQIHYGVDDHSTGRWELQIGRTPTHYWIDDASCRPDP